MLDDVKLQVQTGPGCALLFDIVFWNTAFRGRRQLLSLFAGMSVPNRLLQSSLPGRLLSEAVSDSEVHAAGLRRLLCPQTTSLRFAIARLRKLR